MNKSTDPMTVDSRADEDLTIAPPGWGVNVHFPRVERCAFTGSPPDGFATWYGWADHVFASGVLSGVKIEALPSDVLPRAPSGEGGSNAV